MTQLTIESLDLEGRGVAHVDGRVVFVEGALPFETVLYRPRRAKKNFAVGEVTSIVRESFMRTQPRCAHFGVCGGCSLQHLEAGAQVAVKQRVLEDCLWHIGRVKADSLLPAIYGATWNYRRRARMSARWVEKKGGMLVGFRERHSSFIADMTECHTLPANIAAMLPDLRQMLGRLSIRQKLPQIELASGEQVDALVLRHMEPLTADDLQELRRFADQYGVQWWLQPKGPDTVVPYYPLNAPPLDYSLPEFNVRLNFKPTEFTQVNFEVNRIMVQRAIQLLDPRPGERIADLFCGLGNFSLPLARTGAQVLGIEGSSALVERAAENAALNGLSHSTEFRAMDLFQMDEPTFNQLGHLDKLLIDPPRDGAAELVKALPEQGLSKIVYVSCNPATLARDAGILVQLKGYRLSAAGVVNMFPHTAHVESMALFER